MLVDEISELASQHAKPDLLNDVLVCNSSQLVIIDLDINTPVVMLLLCQHSVLRLLVDLIHAPWVSALRLKHFLGLLEASDSCLVMGISVCDLYGYEVIIILVLRLASLLCDEGWG